jgi:hypothetical protein
VVELFRYYRVLQPVTSLGPLDQKTASGCYLETLEESPNPSAGTPETGYFPKLCSDHRVFPEGAMAHE